MKWIAFKGYNLVIGVYFDRIIYYFETCDEIHQTQIA